MDRDNIRSGKQGIEINLRISILCRASGCWIIDDICTKCPGNLGNAASDRAKSDDSPRLAIDFWKMFCKVSKRSIVNIISIFYIIIVIAQLFKEIEKHGKCMLSNCFCGITGNVSPGNFVGIQIVFIQIVGSGCSNTDQFQILCCSDRIFIDRNFVNDKNICVFHAFRSFFRSGKVIFGNFTKWIKSGQVNIVPDCFGI